MTPTAGALGNAKQSAVIASPKSPKIEAVKEKKKRTSNPGIRQQGGRIYDSENGTTCHQCRQKTIEIKAKCKQCTLYFCPRCLENRYNEAVDEVNALPNWSCPRCRKLCNCSNCRKKAGLEATGILAKVAKTAGFGSVSELLKKNPKAQAFHLMATTTGDGSTSVPGSQSKSTPGRSQQPPNNNNIKSATTKKRKVQAEEQLLDDAQLSPRKIDMPQGAPIAVHKRSTGASGAGRATPSSPPGLAAGSPSRSAATPGGGGGSSKRQRGPAWLDKVPEIAALPETVDPGHIACILEFISVFGTTVLGLRSLPNLAALATELIQPATTRRTDQVCPIPEDSIAAMVHMKLLDVVRHAWEVRGPPVSLAAWQALMRPYYAETVILPVAAAALRDEDGPPAVAGELFARRTQQQNAARGAVNGENEAEDDDDEEEGDLNTDSLAAGAEDSSTQNMNTATNTKSNTTGNNSSSSSAAYLAAAAWAASVEFPEGGYWGLDPGMRVQMLYTLLHDALDTYTVRQVIEKSMENAAQEEKGRRSEVADVRRAAKEAATKQRDQEIALLVAGGGAKQMTLEEQRAIMEAARQKAEEAAISAAAAKLKSLSQVLYPPTVRSAPLGQDRDGQVVFKLQSSAVLTGNTNGLIICGEKTTTENTTSISTTNAHEKNEKNETTGTLRAQPDPSKVVAALDPRGRSEGPLRHAIAAACRVSLASPGRKKLVTSPGRGGTAAATPGSLKKKAVSGTAATPDGAKKKTPAATPNTGKPGSALKTPKSTRK